MSTCMSQSVCISVAIVLIDAFLLVVENKVKLTRVGSAACE